MGLLDSLEQRLDKLVNGSFSKAFKSDVQPTELGAIIQQEIDSKAKDINGQLTAPNLFVIDLGESDFQRLGPYLSVLSSELEKLADEYAIQQRYARTDAAHVRFQLDTRFETGLYRFTSDFGPRPVEASNAREQQVPAPSQTPSVAMIAETEPPRLTAINGQVYRLTQPVSKIGRSEQAEIQVDDSGVSRLHCAIILGSEVIVKDLGSTNGTVVDGHTITEAVLHEGSIINIGSTTLTYTSR